MKKQSLIKGTIILSISGIIAKFLGLLFRYPLILLIGDEGMGYYQISYPLYAFFLAIASGIPLAVSKMVSEKRAVNDYGTAVVILREAIILMAILGGGSSLVFLLFSKQLIHLFKWDAKSYYALMGIGIAPFVIAIMSAFRGFFQGLHNMYPTAISSIIEQVGRVVVGVGLAFLLLPKGIEYSAGGAAFGAAFGGILGGIYLIIKYFKTKEEFKGVVIRKNTKVLDELLRLAIPVSIGATVSSIMSMLDALMVPKKLIEAGFTSKDAAVLYGQLTGKAAVLVHIPITLSMALCTSLIPVIAENFKMNKKDELLSKVNLSFRIGIVLALPCMFGLFSMAAPILRLLFPKNSEGANILKLCSLSIPFIMFTQITTAILQGINKVYTPVLNLVVACVVKVILTTILVPIPSINIYGAIIANIISYSICCILNIIVLNKKLKFKPDYYNLIIKPAYASVIMIIVVVFSYTYVYNYTRRDMISTVISILAGILVYAIQILLLRLFNNEFFKKKLRKRV